MNPANLRTPGASALGVCQIEIDVSSLSLIDAERYFNDLRNVGFPMPDGCSAHGMMDVEEVE